MQPGQPWLREGNYLIVGACAGACTIPVAGTAICVACIGAYAAVGGASITAVASCF